MSELKAFTFGLGQYMEDGSPCVVAFDGEKNPRLASDEKFYLKSEADKVIAELKEELKNSRNARKYWRKEYLIEYEECCNQKYKRCMANAWWCKREANRIEEIAPIFETNNESWEYYSDYWGKWHKRWLEIAEKFKTN